MLPSGIQKTKNKELGWRPPKGIGANWECIITMANEPKNENEVVQRFTSMRQEVQTLYQKLSELDAELQEHELVIKAISGMEEKRKCFRLVGGVLVERYVLALARSGGLVEAATLSAEIDPMIDHRLAGFSRRHRSPRNPRASSTYR